MKKWWFAFVVPLILYSCGLKSPSISIMTLNTSIETNKDSLQNWDNKLPLITWIIKKKSPNIIGFQEVEKRQLVSLTYELSQYACVGEELLSQDIPNEYNPIFFRKDLFSLIAKSQFWLSETTEITKSIGLDENYPRFVTWVKLKNNKTGHIFFVFNTHFSYNSRVASENSANLLLKKIKLIADNAPVILTGDFNFISNNLTYKIITESNKLYYPLTDTEHISASLPKGGNNKTEEKSDYIFVNDYFGVRSHTTYPFRKDSICNSSHFPLIVNLFFDLQKTITKGKKEISPITN